MKNDKEGLLRAIREIISLLRDCNYTTPANLYESKLKILEGQPTDSKDFQDTVQWLSRSIGGMGSFDDMPLVPKPTSKLSPSNIRKYQVELEDRLSQSLKSFAR